MNHLARLKRAGLLALPVIALAGCGLRFTGTAVAPSDPLSVERCTVADCSIQVLMDVDAAGCRYTLPAYYVVPRSSDKITWTLVPPAGGAAQFRFPAGTTPVEVKATKLPPWTSPAVAQPTSRYTVERSAKDPQATSYGLKVEFLPKGDRDWKPCPQLDPMIISTD